MERIYKLHKPKKRTTNVKFKMCLEFIILITKTPRNFVHRSSHKLIQFNFNRTKNQNEWILNEQTPRQTNTFFDFWNKILVSWFSDLSYSDIHLLSKLDDCYILCEMSKSVSSNSTDNSSSTFAFFEEASDFDSTIYYVPAPSSPPLQVIICWPKFVQI